MSLIYFDEFNIPIEKKKRLLEHFSPVDVT